MEFDGEIIQLSKYQELLILYTRMHIYKIPGLYKLLTALVNFNKTVQLRGPLRNLKFSVPGQTSGAYHM